MTRAWVSLAVACLLGACGGTSYDDCRSFGCHAPFVCAALPDQIDNHTCQTPPDQLPGCSGSPSDLSVPFKSAYTSGRTLHWALAPGCIPLTYHPSLGELAGKLNSARKAWNDVTCSRLCFGGASASEHAPALKNAERRVHVQLVEEGGMPRTALYSEPVSGRMLSATIDFASIEMAMAATEADLVALLGQAAGLSVVDSAVDSALATGAPKEAPTALDEQSLCRLYGTPSFCEE